MCNRQFIECARIPVEFVARLLRYGMPVRCCYLRYLLLNLRTV